MHHILLIDDDAQLGPPLAAYFARFDMVLECALRPSTGLERLRQGGLDAAILDVMLPEMDGFALCRAIRKSSDIPIIMLTARGEENDRVSGLESGVDDYVVKPFSARELLARIRAVMRRSREDEDDGSVTVGGLRIDGAAHRVFAGDQPLHVGPTEYRLLHFFMTHAERVYTRTQLLDHVWGGNVYVEERTVDVHIRRLRKALEPFRLDDMVQTVRGSGYRFSASVA